MHNYVFEIDGGWTIFLSQNFVQHQIVQELLFLLLILFRVLCMCACLLISKPVGGGQLAVPILVTTHIQDSIRTVFIVFN